MVSLIRVQSSALEMVLHGTWLCSLNNLSSSVRIILCFQLSSIFSLLPAHSIKDSKALFKKLFAISLALLVQAFNPKDIDVIIKSTS